MSTIRLPLTVLTAAVLAVLPAGVADAARYASALLAERVSMRRGACDC